uniref:uncharacterized protein n=1 Tax=Myxine glutinosa TaxID=7769 RepID=UPI0035902BC8
MASRRTRCSGASAGRTADLIANRTGITENDKDTASKQSRDQVSVPEGQSRVFFCVCQAFNILKYLLLLLAIPPILNFASLQREADLLAPNGNFVDVGLGQRFFLSCQGKGEPVVLLDAPTGASSDVWFFVQQKLSELTQVCSYDRASLGFSKQSFPNESTGLEKTWRMFTTGRMVDDLHRIIQEVKLPKPFILVGSEIGALNARFFSHIYDWEVSQLVLINPLTEELFNDDNWINYWHAQLIPSLQLIQIAAVTGLNRLGLVTGLMQQPLRGENIPEDIIRRQKSLLCSLQHAGAVLDEHFFINESIVQVRDISRFKPHPKHVDVTVISWKMYDEQLPEHVNKAWERSQENLQHSLPYPSTIIMLDGTARHALTTHPSAIVRTLQQLVLRRRDASLAQ